MKKIIALLLTFVLLFTAASCRNGEEITETTTSAVVTSAQQQTVLSTAETTESATVSETAFSDKQTDASTTKKPKTTLASTFKTTVTQFVTRIVTTAEKKTRRTTTRRNYFPETSSTLVVTSTTKRTTTESEETQTDRVTTTKKRSPVTVPVTEPKKLYCTISIDCSTILDNQDKLKEEKKPFVPANGKILDTVRIEFEQGETVFDVFKRACKNNVCTDNCSYCQSNGILFEYEYTPGYGNYYIEGIHQIYEKDCGSKSGWMYKVNGVYADTGCSSYVLKDGDVIEWVYTCNLGEDVGAEL